MIQRSGSYWHMLPEAAQARKAIWEAINPHTGKRRIEEAFPKEIWDVRREQEMFLKSTRFNSTWQVVGSDNFNSLVGSPPVGVVFSEWSIANSAAWAYMRPILAENGGWALFIYTPRGKNHGYSTLKMAESEDDWFGQVLTVEDTGALPKEMLDSELNEYIKEYGPEQGQSFFDQEYMCSFDAAILGAVYGSWIRAAEKEGRVKRGIYDPNLAVHTAWDLGYSDATAIWFWQQAGDEIRLLDYYENTLQGVEHYCRHLWEVGRKRKYKYGQHFVPHDAKNKLLAAGGRSIVEQAYSFGVKMFVIPATTEQQQIQALRRLLPNMWFDEDGPGTDDGLEHLKQYQFEYKANMSDFSLKPKHDKHSHCCDALEIIGQVLKKEVKREEPLPVGPKLIQEATLDELWRESESNTGANRRI